MADERCPLCMEKLKHGECASCGYKLPDEENLSAIYDAEPAEYYEPEPVREITPEIQMEEIYPYREEAIPNFKVRDDEGKTVRSRIDLASIDEKKNSNGNPYAMPYPNNNPNVTGGNPNASNGNPNASDGNPYAGYTPEGVPNSGGGSPFANPSVNQSTDTESTSAFMKKYWWLLLLAFMFPIIGIIINSTMKHELKQYKASYLVIIAIVLGFVLPP